MLVIRNRSSPTQSFSSAARIIIYRRVQVKFLGEAHRANTEWWNLPRAKDSQLQFHAAHNHKICSLDERKKNGWFKENVDWNGTRWVDDLVWALRRCNLGLSAADDKPELRSLELLITSLEHILKHIFFLPFFLNTCTHTNANAQLFLWNDFFQLFYACFTSLKSAERRFWQKQSTDSSHCQRLASFWRAFHWKFPKKM